MAATASEWLDQNLYFVDVQLVRFSDVYIEWLSLGYNYIKIMKYKKWGAGAASLRGSEASAPLVPYQSGKSDKSI